MRRYLPLLLALLGLCAVVSALFVLNPNETAWMPRCIFHLWTGYSCPGCGLQRAVHAALHGQWAEAVHYNLFLLLSLPYCAACVLASAWPKGRLHDWMCDKVYATPVLRTVVLLTCAWWVVRNILGI